MANNCKLRYDEKLNSSGRGADLSRATELPILDQIVVRKRAELLLEQARTPMEKLEEMVKQARRESPRRGFRRALERKAPAIIAEIKKASPSRGVIAEKFEPAEIARSYEAAGAAALSVLTDVQFFQGSLAHLEQARAAVQLPVLRKDFTLDRYHVWQAAAHGADAILLIVAVLTPAELVGMLEQARDLDLDALVEVHDREEVARALDAGADLIGVNNRNLKTFEVKLETSLELAEHLPGEVLAVSESGIRTHEDIARLAAAGYRAFLVGERLMSQAEPGRALEALLGGVKGGARDH